MEKDNIEQVEHYYDQNALTEWYRLERHRTECAITERVLQEYLPAAQKKILDIGGGPGRYTLALTATGHQVTLLDLSRSNLLLAQQKARENNISIFRTIQGNALDLSMFVDQRFDVALLMGPLYHLFTEEGRIRALREARNVLCADGLIFATFITRYAVLRDLAQRDPQLLNKERRKWEEVLATGIYQADTGLGFTDAYFSSVHEIEPLMQQAGFKTISIIGCEGAVARNEKLINQLDEESWKTWVDFNYQAGKDPSMYGAADHLLYVGKRSST